MRTGRDCTNCIWQLKASSKGKVYEKIRRVFTTVRRSCAPQNRRCERKNGIGCSLDVAYGLHADMTPDNVIIKLPTATAKRCVNVEGGRFTSNPTYLPLAPRIDPDPSDRVTSVESSMSENRQLARLAPELRTTTRRRRVQAWLYQAGSIRLSSHGKLAETTKASACASPAP